MFYTMFNGKQSARPENKIIKSSATLFLTNIMQIEKE